MDQYGHFVYVMYSRVMVFAMKLDRSDGVAQTIPSYLWLESSGG